MEPIEFCKYQAAGNDFLVVTPPLPHSVVSLARAMCARRTGVGADGLLVINDYREGWRVQVVNADGSPAETSGNGMRCAARFLADCGRAPVGSTAQLFSDAGPVAARIEPETISVDMGPPRFQDSCLPQGDTEPVRIQVRAGGRLLTGTAVSMGNPHLVVEIEAGESLTDFPLETLGRAAAEAGSGFPEGVNVEVVRPSPDGVDARVWERGVGETLACGSGACAIGASQLFGTTSSDPMRVSMPGGALTVEWKNPPNGSLWLTGDAKRVFVGRYAVEVAGGGL